MQYGRLLAILVLVQQQLCGVSSKKLAKTTVVAVASSAQQVKLITASFTGGRETMYGDVVEKVMIVWNDTATSPPKMPCSFTGKKLNGMWVCKKGPAFAFESVPLKGSAYDSVVEQVTTPSVLVLDIDAEPHPELVRCLLLLWGRYPRQLIGVGASTIDAGGKYSHFSSRALSLEAVQEFSFTEKAFSLIRSETMIFATDYLAKYSSAAVAHSLAGGIGGCEGIIMNAVIANASRLAPWLVDIYSDAFHPRIFASTRNPILDPPVPDAALFERCVQSARQLFGQDVFIETKAIRKCPNCAHGQKGLTWEAYNAALAVPVLLANRFDPSALLSAEEQSSVLERALVDFYRVHSPEKESQVKKALAHFKGKESTLVKQLESKYKAKLDIKGASKQLGLWHTPEVISCSRTSKPAEFPVSLDAFSENSDCPGISFRGSIGSFDEVLNSSEGRVVFVERGRGSRLHDLLSAIASRPQGGAVVLLLAGEDAPLTMREQEKLLQSPRISKCYATNLHKTARPDFFVPLPLGVPYHKVHPLSFGLRRIEAGVQKIVPWAQRENKLLVFKMGDSHPFRAKYSALLAKARFKRLVYFVTEYVQHAEMMELLGKYRAVLSPPGVGYDCFRTWEALHLGAVPFVTLDGAFDERLFDGSGAVVIPSPSELTAEILEASLRAVKSPAELADGTVRMRTWTSRWTNDLRLASARASSNSEL